MSSLNDIDQKRAKLLKKSDLILLGITLGEVKKTRSLTLANISELCDIDPSTLSYFFNGKVIKFVNHDGYDDYSTKISNAIYIHNISNILGVDERFVYTIISDVKKHICFYDGTFYLIDDEGKIKKNPMGNPCKANNEKIRDFISDAMNRTPLQK